MDLQVFNGNLNTHCHEFYVKKGFARRSSKQDWLSIIATDYPLHYALPILLILLDSNISTLLASDHQNKTGHPNSFITLLLQLETNFRLSESGASYLLIYICSSRKHQTSISSNCFTDLRKC